jgi:hypothetical protein
VHGKQNQNGLIIIQWKEVPPRHPLLAFPQEDSAEVAEMRARLDGLADELRERAQDPDQSFEAAFVRDPMPADEDDDRSLLGEGAFGTTHRMRNEVRRKEAFAIFLSLSKNTRFSPPPPP